MTIVKKIEYELCPFCGNRPIRAWDDSYAFCDTDGCPIKGFRIHTNKWNSRIEQTEAGKVKQIALDFAKWEYPQYSICPEDFDLFIKQPDYAIKSKIEGYTELVKIAERGLSGNMVEVEMFIKRFVSKYPNHPLCKPFWAIIHGEPNHLVLDNNQSKQP
jgi:hypothetical protein